MKTDELVKRPGAIMAVCAGFGLMFGLLWFGNQPVGSLAGVVGGLIVGAIAEYQLRNKQ
jgi:hypothetical protein